MSLEDGMRDALCVRYLEQPSRNIFSLAITAPQETEDHSSRSDPASMISLLRVSAALCHTDMRVQAVSLAALLAYSVSQTPDYVSTC